MKRELTIIPKLTIHPSKITLYNEYNWNPGKPTKSKQPWESTYTINHNGEIVETKPIKNDKFINSKRSAQGLMSKTAIKKCKTATEYLVTLSNKKSLHSNTTGRRIQSKISFITLTLSSTQIHSDNEIKEKCLNQFLVELRKYHKVKNYVWRAEKQKNGNIHFHLIIDKYIDWWKLRNKWNRIQNKLGYVDKYQEKLKKWHSPGFKVRKDLIQKWPIEKQYKAYLAGKENDFTKPNSTDVHSVRKIINIQSYLTKYLTKNEIDSEKLSEIEKEKLLVQGRLWGCNYELSKIKGCQLDLDSVLEDELRSIEDKFHPHKFKSDFFTVIYIDLNMIKNSRSDALFKYFAEYLLTHFSYNTSFELGTG